MRIFGFFPQKSSQRMIRKAGIRIKRGSEANQSITLSMPPVEVSLFRVSLTSPAIFLLSVVRVSSSVGTKTIRASSALSRNRRLHTKLREISSRSYMRKPWMKRFIFGRSWIILPTAKTTLWKMVVL